MGLYLYCLLPGGRTPPAGLVGLEDAVVHSRRAGGLFCWVSPLARVPAATVEHIRRHNAVVSAALAAGVTPLPVRYGQLLADEAALEARLAEHEAEHGRALERVRDAVEFGVRVLDPAAEPAPAADGSIGETDGSGTAYLRAVAARLGAERGHESRGREIAGRMRTILGPLVRAERVDPLRSRHGIVSVAHLVERTGADAYRGRIEALGRECPELRFFVSGPWPPYSFAA